MHCFCKQIAPRSECNNKGIMRIYILCQTICRPLLFGLKRTKYAVPNDKYPAMIFIEVFQITSMMNAMMGRGVEKKFHPSGTLMNGFGMDPELINEAHLLHEENPDGMKSNQRHPCPE